jgi:hypothetical protein
MGYACRSHNGPTLATFVQPMNAPLRRPGGLSATQIVRWAARERPAQY